MVPSLVFFFYSHIVQPNYNTLMPAVSCLYKWWQMQKSICVESGTGNAFPYKDMIAFSGCVGSFIAGALLKGALCFETDFIWTFVAT